MDASVVTIAPQALTQFQEVHLSLNPLNDPPRNPEKTLRRILQNAAEPHPEIKGMLGEQEPVAVYQKDHYLFAVSTATQALVAVTDVNELFPDLKPDRAARAMSLKRQMSQERKALGLKWDTILPTPPFDLSKVSFSAHALERFKERFPAHAANGAEKAARELLAYATEEGSITKVGVVKRLIDNGFREARYFKLGKCRFVVKEEAETGTFTVLTIEWAYLD